MCKSASFSSENCDYPSNWEEKLTLNKNGYDAKSCTKSVSSESLVENKDHPVYILPMSRRVMDNAEKDK